LLTPRSIMVGAAWSDVGGGEVRLPQTGFIFLVPADLD